jgi:hypothetical protein
VKTRIKLLPVIIILLILSSCQKDYFVNREQKVLFQMSYVNFAWGAVNSGFFIDTDGNVLRYYNPSSWNPVNKGMALSREEISENLSYCFSTGIRISTDELRTYVDYIDNLASSKVSAPVQTGADMGSRIIFCFKYIPETGSSLPVVVKCTGDFSYENLNFYAKKVAEWMNGINMLISSNH